MRIARIGCVLLGVTLGACSRTTPETAASATAAAPPAAASASESAAVSDAKKFIDWMRQDRAVVIGQIAAKEFALQGRLMEFSGLTRDLGGAERANSALRDLMRAVEASGAPPDVAHWTRIDDESAIGGRFSVAQATVELASVALAFAKEYGNGEPSRTGHEGNGSKGELKVAEGAVDYTSSKEVSASGLTGQFAVQMKVNVCPDAAGEILLEMTGKASLSSATSGRGANTEFHATARRRLDDDARMSDLDLNANLQTAEFGGGAGTFVDMDYEMSTTSGLMGSKVNHRSSQATDADVANTEALLETIRVTATSFSELTRSVWEAGKCVRIDTASAPGARRRAKPSTNFSLDARARSAVDGSSVGGTVRATLQGGASLDPADTKVRADAKFQYVAPAERDQVAAVSFEARSKRGVGLATLDFDTQTGEAYLMTGGAKELHFTGMVCDLEKTFVLRSDRPLADVTIRFEPTSRERGQYSYTGTVIAYDKNEKFTFGVHGKGKYEIRFDGDIAVSGTAEGPGTVETSLGPQDGYGKEQYVLTIQEGADCPSNAEAAP